MNKTRQWAVLTAVACLAVLVAGWFLVVKPQRAHASSLKTQTTGVQSQNDQLQAKLTELRAAQKDLPAQQKLLSQIGTKIPDNPALPALIRQLSAAADGAGVDLVSLAPAQPTTVGGATGAAAASPLASISIAINVSGSYFNIEQFFAAVESLNRAMLVNGFTLSGGQAGTATLPGALGAQITATVFESPQTAPVAAATTVH